MQLFACETICCIVSWRAGSMEIFILFCHAKEDDSVGPPLWSILKFLWLFLLCCHQVYVLGFEWYVMTTTGCIAIKFGSYIHDGQRMNPHDLRETSKSWKCSLYYPHPLGGLPQNFVKTSMVPRWCVPMTLVIPWLFLLSSSSQNFSRPIPCVMTKYLQSQRHPWLDFVFNAN